jgi:hypothetical protein
MAGLEELAVHRRRHLGAGLHAQVIAEEDDVDVRTDSAQEPLQVRQMVLDELIEERMRPGRLSGQEPQEVVLRYRN